jgi:hypothetical protein
MDPEQESLRVGARLMRPNEERWKELCRQAAVEQDPAKLNHLVKEIDEFFDSKRDPNPESARQKER